MKYIQINENIHNLIKNRKMKFIHLINSLLLDYRRDNIKPIIPPKQKKKGLTVKIAETHLKFIEDNFLNLSDLINALLYAKLKQFL